MTGYHPGNSPDIPSPLAIFIILNLAYLALILATEGTYCLLHPCAESIPINHPSTYWNASAYCEVPVTPKYTADWESFLYLQAVLLIPYFTWLYIKKHRS